MNINDFDRIYRRTKKGVGVTNGTVRLRLKRIAAGKVRILTHVTVENRGNADTDCRIGIRHGGIDHYLDELNNMAQNELAVSRSDILLGEGDRFFADLTGTENDSELVMTCIGWELDL